MESGTGTPLSVEEYRRVRMAEEQKRNERAVQEQAKKVAEAAATKIREKQEEEQAGQTQNGKSNDGGIFTTTDPNRGDGGGMENGQAARAARMQEQLATRSQDANMMLASPSRLKDLSTGVILGVVIGGIAVMALRRSDVVVPTNQGKGSGE